MTALYWACFSLAFFVGGLAIGAGLMAWRSRSRGPRLAFRDSVALTFETRDGGRTWFFRGQPVECSPLSDRLQDAIQNVGEGWQPGTTRERKDWLRSHGFAPDGKWAREVLP